MGREVDAADEALRALGNQGKRGVPDAPFKETWPDLGLKQQVLDAAADPNAQWIGHTSGATQAARYDLSKQIDSLQWVPWPRAGEGHGVLVAFKDGQQVMKKRIPSSQLADYIGKEPANRLLAQEAGEGGVREISGLDLQVGGEGMHEFYDKLLPARLQKILEPFGGKVERAGARPERVWNVSRGVWGAADGRRGTHRADKGRDRRGDGCAARGGIV